MLGMTDNTRVSSFINDTFEQPGYFLYAQDDLKVTTRLTLNLGIRYEFISHPTERHDAQASYNIATGALEIVSGRNDSLPSNFFSRESPMYQLANALGLPMTLSSAVTAVQAVSRAAASALLSRQVSTSSAHADVAMTDRPIDSKRARSICETLLT